MPKITFKSDAESKKFQDSMQAALNNNTMFKDAQKEGSTLEKIISEIGKFFTFNNKKDPAPKPNESPLSTRMLGIGLKGKQMQELIQNGKFDELKAVCDTMNKTKPTARETLNEYFQAYGHKSLNNEAIKYVSGVVQLGENLGNKLAMQERRNNMEQVMTQWGGFNERYKSLDEAGTNFVKDCQKYRINPQNPTEKKENLQKETEKLKTENEKLGTKDAHEKIVSEAGKEKLTHVKKLDEYRQRLVKADNDMAEIKGIKDEIKGLGRLEHNIKTNERAISIEESRIEGYKRSIAELSGKKQGADEARQEMTKIENSMFGNVINEAKKNSAYIENVGSAMEKLQEVSQYSQMSGVDIRDLYKKTNGGTENMKDLNRMQQRVLKSYVEAKGDLLQTYPDLADKFNAGENSMEPFPDSFLTSKDGIKINKELKNAKELDQKLQGNKTYQRYMQLSEKCAEYDDAKLQIDHYEKNINESTGKINDLKNKNADIQKQKKEGLEKLNSKLMEKDKSGDLNVEDPIDVEKEYKNIDNLWTNKVKKEVNHIKEAMPERAKKVSELEVKIASEESIISRINGNSTKIAVYEATINAMDNLSERKNTLSENYKSLMADMNNGLKANPNIKENVCYDQISERLNYIKDHFHEKSNGKMSPSCEKMMTSVDKVLENIKNGKSQNEIKQSLADMSKASEEYINAKNEQGKWRPKWTESEQRHVRLGFAAELKDFGNTGIEMVDDIARNKQEEGAIQFSGRSYDKIVQHSERYFNESFLPDMQQKAAPKPTVKQEQPQIQASQNVLE